MQLAVRVLHNAGHVCDLFGNVAVGSGAVAVPAEALQIGAARTIEEVLSDYPYLQREDILQAIGYARGRV